MSLVMLSTLGEANMPEGCYISESDPGAVGRRRLWLKASTGELKIRNDADAAWVDVTAAAMAWSGITGTPTTVAGYGITDAVSSTDLDTVEAEISPPFQTLTDGATITWDLASARHSHATVTLEGNRTLSVTNPVAGCSGVLLVVQDGTGSRTLTLPGSEINGGVTLSTIAGATDSLFFVYDGTSYYWFKPGVDSGIAALDDLPDVTAPTPSDGDVLTWDAGTSRWVNQAPSSGDPAMGGDLSGTASAATVEAIGGITVDVTGAASGKAPVHDGTSFVMTDVATQTELDTAQQGVKGVNDQSGTTYTLVLADAGKWVRCSNAAAIALTVPPNSSVAFPVGTVVTISQSGAGAVTITAGAGVTINTRTGLTLVTNGQYAVAGIMKSGTDTWTAFGDLV